MTQLYNLKAVKLTYYIAFCLVFVLVSCNQTKHVPSGSYLLVKNKLQIKGDKLDEDLITPIIKQQPNRKNFGVKFKLWAYNRETYFYLVKSDSATIAEKRFRQNRKLLLINKNRREREARINNKRILKAQASNESFYTEKKIPLKDTIAPRLFFREWFKYKVGERPVIFDSSLFNKSVQQLEIYLKKRGYYYGKVSGDLDTIGKNKISCNYFIETGLPYIIDSIKVECPNESVLGSYLSYYKKTGDSELKGEKLDSDVLSNYKDKVAKYMRDEGFFGFSSSHIEIFADSVKSDMRVNLRVVFNNRIIIDQDKEYQVQHKTTYIRNVYFHIADTTFIEGNFAKVMNDLKLQPYVNNFINTKDVFEYRQIYMTKEEKKRRNIDLDKDTLQPFRFATFYYNNEMAIRPEIIELQNYLEANNIYKEYYLERTYTRLLQLGVFQTIKPDLIEVPGTNLIDVHYYLVPAEKHSTSFEPRFTNSNGFLGVAASVNYNNKNLFRGSERLTISFSGGFESTPPVFDELIDGTKIKNAGRSFNTFEVGPSLKLDLPGLFPMSVRLLSKRKRPRTILSTAYNYQNRLDFDRGVFQLNYLYKFILNKTQVMQFGFPFASVIKFVSIDNKSAAFEGKLNQTNDLFLRNAYSDQFIWQDFKVTFEYNSKGSDKKRKTTFFYNSSFDHAGLFTSFVSRKMDTVTNVKQIFGVPYSQFIRLDNEFIVGHPIGKTKSLNFRLAIGAGIPYGNSKTSLPYDYSFFAGGANDNRGWRARSLGPGSYKYYLDTNRTATQIGDLRLGGSAEFRFAITKLFKGAFFMDAANIWTTKDDVKRPGGKFTSDWYKELALTAGVGLRLDFSYFIVRFDLGLPITNPALPEGSRWIFQSRDAYYDEGLAVFGPNYKSKMPKPFIPNVNFGIGYPF